MSVANRVADVISMVDPLGLVICPYARFRAFDQVFNPDYTITNGVYLGSFPVLKFSGTFTWAEETARLEFTFNEVGGLVIGLLERRSCCGINMLYLSQCWEGRTFQVSWYRGGKRVAMVFSHWCFHERKVCTRPLLYIYEVLMLTAVRVGGGHSPRRSLESFRRNDQVTGGRVRRFLPLLSMEVINYLSPRPRPCSCDRDFFVRSGSLG